MAKSYGFKIKNEDGGFGEQINFATTSDLITDIDNNRSLQATLNKMQAFAAVGVASEDDYMFIDSTSGTVPDENGDEWNVIKFPSNLAPSKTSFDKGFYLANDGILICNHTGELEVDINAVFYAPDNAEGSITIFYRLMTEDDETTFWINEANVTYEPGESKALPIPKMFIQADQGESIILHVRIEGNGTVVFGPSSYMTARYIA